MRCLSRGGILLIFLFSPWLIHGASSLDIVINEIAWMGTKVEGIESKNWWRYEWLELYNDTNQTISLDGWKIELYRTELDWSLGLKGVILAKDYFLIVASDKIFSNYDLNYSNLGGKINNNGQKVLLKDNLDNIIDTIDCDSYGKWFTGDNSTKQTMERKNPTLSGDSLSNWITSQNPGGTPKAKNSTSLSPQPEEPVILTKPEPQPEPQPEQPAREEKIAEAGTPPTKMVYPGGIVINEILPSPTGPDESEEWIEIFNQNNFEVNLSDWGIADAIGKITTYAFPKRTTISPGGFLVLYRPTTKITLNNDGDGVSLIRPDGEIVETINYPKAPQGESYNLIKEEEWAWSTILTPGSNNIFAQTEIKKEGEKKSETKAQTLEASPETKSQLASIKEQLPKSSKSLFVFLIAFGLAIFSGVIIFLLKRKLK